MTSVLHREYLRIGELADRAGVSVATIKFYIREGLLPPPPVKTGRTMGYYDQAYLDRLITIRKLREEHFLPIKAIRVLLEERGDRPLDAAELAVVAKLGPAVAQKLDAQGSARAPLDRKAVLGRYKLAGDELDTLVELGLVGDDGGKKFSGADQELLDALARSEQAGLTRDRFPVEGLGHYVELLGELARREVRRFLAGIADLPPEEVTRLAEQGMQVTEPIVALVRRRLILRELRAELERTARRKTSARPKGKDKPRDKERRVP